MCVLECVCVCVEMCPDMCLKPVCMHVEICILDKNLFSGMRVLECVCTLT